MDHQLPFGLAGFRILGFLGFGDVQGFGFQMAKAISQAKRYFRNRATKHPVGRRALGQRGPTARRAAGFLGLGAPYRSDSIICKPSSIS